MKAAPWSLLAATLGSCALAAAAPASGQLPPVPKTNPLKVYMHYMPWFETPATLGGSNWGYHWKFNNQNPNIVDATGKRQIASHYYPKIGPYASSDPDVIEYHLLLMRLSGVDGLMIDWYGVQGTNGDIVSLRENSEDVIRKVDDFGLKFSVILEDRFSNGISQAQANVAYLRQNPNPVAYPDYPGYFQNPDYIRLGAGNDPLLGVFGPITFQQPSQWTTILAQAGEDVNFQTLWYESHDAGSNADGEYAWIYEDEAADNHLIHQRAFLNSRADDFPLAGAVAYPGFNDFYQEGGVGNIVPFEIPHSNGQTLDAVLDQFQLYDDADVTGTLYDYLQLATFNDFGEGTMFEPTVETGFSYLRRIQEFTGVSFGEAELQLVYELYLARKKYAGNASKQAMLNLVSQDLAALEIVDAMSQLQSIAPAGDYDADGDVDAGDFTTWRAAFGKATILYGSGADGNFDGKIDAGDYVVWRKSFAAGGGGAGLNAPSVPEPASALIGLVTMAWCCCFMTQRRRGG